MRFPLFLGLARLYGYSLVMGDSFLDGDLLILPSIAL